MSKPLLNNLFLSSILILALSLAMQGCQSARQQGTATSNLETIDDSWVGSMHQLKAHLENLAPFIFDSRKFESTENRSYLGREIKGMAQASQNLNHNPTLTHRDPTVRFVASQFSQSLNRASAALQGGHSNYARYELMKVISSCVQCHSRMQQGPEFKTFFFDNPFLKNLPVVDQAEYLVATRQFDQAYKVLLKGLSSKDSELASHGQYEKLAFLGLQLSVQYEEDAGKALRVIDSIRKSPLANQFLKEKAEVWKVSADRWKRQKGAAMTMAEAKTVLQSPANELQVMRAIPVGLSRLSEDISGQELGESLLMMGKAYEFLSDIQPFELHENYYESCIRSVPHTQVAKKCFASLRSSIEAGFSGTSGTHIPVDIQVWLDQLKKAAD